MKWLLALAIVLSLSAFVDAQYRVFHRFSGPPNDASYLIGALVLDAKGDLYGASANGGKYLSYGDDPG